jgi:hypothetical protein
MMDGQDSMLHFYSTLSKARKVPRVKILGISHHCWEAFKVVREYIAKTFVPQAGSGSRAINFHEIINTQK